MDSESYSTGVKEWMNRARRAQHLMGQVDLQRIVDHDIDEFEKLTRVSQAMDTLCKEVENPIPGVAASEEAPTLDENQVKRSELMNALDAAGYGDRLGRIFMSNCDDPIKPVDIIPHHQGLPEFDVCVAPEHSPPGGAQGIFISSQGIFAAFIPEPATRYKWRILRSRPYDDHDELLTTVHLFATTPTE